MALSLLFVQLRIAPSLQRRRYVVAHLREAELQQIEAASKVPRANVD